jgi:hypothetical protein
MAEFCVYGAFTCGYFMDGVEIPNVAARVAFQKRKPGDHASAAPKIFVER